MKISKKLFRISIVVLILVIGLDSLISLYEKRNLISNKFNSYIENPKDNDKKWSEKIMNGGYILHFRHAERQKWIDVEMYDSLESDVHKNGLNNSRMAENDYFKDAVCLNSRGMIQAKAIGEHLKKIKLPLGYVISSPSCRSRQTAELSFGGFDKLDRNLVHRGPYNQKEEDHAEVLKDLYMNLPINEKILLFLRIIALFILICL
jgi:hypothetical protein